MNAVVRFLCSLRFRLVLLFPVALVPVFALTVNEYRHERERQKADWEQRCVQSAKAAVAKERDRVNGTRQFLKILASLPQVRSGDLTQCQPLFAELLADNPSYSNLGLIRTNGDVACSARPVPGLTNVAECPFFQEAWHGKFSVGTYQIDRITGQKTLNFGFPVRDPQGKFGGVAFVTLDLERFNRRTDFLQNLVSSQSLWIKTDAQGVILSAEPEPEKWVGRPLPWDAVLQCVLTGREGLVTISNPDGSACLCAVAHAPSVLLSQNISVITGIPEQALLAGANKALVHNLLCWGVAAVLSLAFALFFTRRLVDCESKRAQEKVRQAQEQSYLILDTANEGIWVLDEYHRTIFANRRLAEMLGYQMGEMVGRNAADLLVHENVADYARRMEARRRNLAESYESRIRSKDGKNLWVLISATPRRDEKGQFSGVFAMLVDLTPHKEAERSLHELSGQLLQVQDEERRRIGRELHDHAAQWLAALAMNLSRIESMTRQLDPKAQKLLGNSLWILEQCSSEIRTLSFLLHPPLLDELGLAQAIDEYADEFSRRSGIRITSEIPPDLGRLPRDVEIALFRVVQESFINIHRHSGSSIATVRLTRGDSQIELEVIDSGHGMEKAITRNGDKAGPLQCGVGIAGMRERLKQLGGRLEIETSDHGTIVRACVTVK